ncbi:hypothetical protein ACIQNU_42925 [Streptomyces sp. NPDC091292]|uniref:hypothetical protein n=1 Tax=Streptomyces sp. NPDC091292 TaxID=3365991 RepID=UPI00380DA19B
MPTITTATALRHPKKPYENWRPPLIGVTLLVPVGVDGLLVADTTGHGDITLPTGSVEADEPPERAARRVLRGTRDELPVLRRVAVRQVQMRRRRVISHLIATRPLTRDDTAGLTYRDPRAVLRVLPTGQVIADFPEQVRTLILYGLQALAIGVIAHLEGDTVQHLESVAPT